jgi:hypothetical protein
MYKKHSYLLLLFVILAFAGLYSCNSADKVNAPNPKIATVFDYELYYDDLPTDFRANTTRSDSIALVNSFVDQWVRKMILLHEAQIRKPKSLDIEKLVEDYKQSLLINNLEKQVIAQELDTIILEHELNGLYNEIKENFIQEHPITRLVYFKIPEKSPQIDKFYDWWKKENFSRMIAYAEKYGEVSLSDKNTWWEWNDIKNLIDEDIQNKYSMKEPTAIQKNIGDYEYFINIYEFVDINEISPLGYVEDQIRNIIIQKRKTIVMNEYLERIYMKEIKKKNIVLHNKIDK